MTARIGLVISTLDEGIFKIQELLKVRCEEIIVVHQTSNGNRRAEYDAFYQTYHNTAIRFVQMNGKGLSRSRNAGLANATAEYVLICDDDGTFEPNCTDILRHAIEEHPSADIFTFKTRTPDGRPYKKYATSVFRHTKRSNAKVTSREILIRRSWWAQSQLQFDERFGLGSELPTGEEYIFLCDALDKGAEILFIPEFIVIHPYESSGKDFNEKNARAKGAVFARTYGIAGYGVAIAFAVKKYDHYKQSISFLKFTRNILAGCRQFLRNG